MTFGSLVVVGVVLTAVTEFWSFAFLFLVSCLQGTPEQRALVKRINGCEDYYAILGISDKSCSEDTIKRSYKKLALKLHPDKCKVRGAEDAFKAVSRAFSCLSDPQKRRSYDRFGSEQPGTFSASCLLVSLVFSTLPLAFRYKGASLTRARTHSLLLRLT